MRNLTGSVCLLAALSLCGCKPASTAQVVTQQTGYQTVEAACGECQFGMEGSGCDLAVRIDDVAYFVDGTAIDDHGDAHATDGFCNAIRYAKVKGEIVAGRFRASEFELLPDDTEPN